MRLRSGAIEVLKSDRAIMASFILLPLAKHENGRRAAEIIRTSPFAFDKVLRNYGSFDRLKMARIISNSCIRLTREGLLAEVGRRVHTFQIPYRFYIPGRPESVEYLSPVYNLTEAGAIQALACMDCRKLPELRAKTRKKKRRNRNPYKIDAYEAAREFLRVIE
jgi:predicted amidohydrolase